MVFQSPDGIEQNKKVQLVQAVIMVALVIGWLIYIKINAPRMDVANGIYRNGCCSDVIIKDGQISHGKKALALTILTMKHGYAEYYVNAKFTNEGMQEADDGTSIVFFSEGGKRAFSLPIGQSEYTFIDSAQ